MSVAVKRVEKPLLPPRSDRYLQRRSLSGYSGCLYCICVPKMMYALRVAAELRDIDNDPQCRSELLLEGGKLQAPCLRIVIKQPVRWLHEDEAIVAYLRLVIRRENLLPHRVPHVE